MLPSRTRPTQGTEKVWDHIQKVSGEHKAETSLMARDMEPPIRGGSGSWKRELLGSWGQGVACNKHILQGRSSPGPHTEVGVIRLSNCKEHSH